MVRAATAATARQRDVARIADGEGLECSPAGPWVSSTTTGKGLKARIVLETRVATSKPAPALTGVSSRIASNASSSAGCAARHRICFPSSSTDTHTTRPGYMQMAGSGFQFRGCASRQARDRGISTKAPYRNSRRSWLGCPSDAVKRCGPRWTPKQRPAPHARDERIVTGGVTGSGPSAPSQGRVTSTMLALPGNDSLHKSDGESHPSAPAVCFWRLRSGFPGGERQTEHGRRSGLLDGVSIGSALIDSGLAGMTVKGPLTAGYLQRGRRRAVCGNRHKALAEAGDLNWTSDLVWPHTQPVPGRRPP